ncbi:dynactin subunit 6-like [Ylistrum balloti]|uniref:dynactin subunit 6-like n=1 Tax=Ylistrum balloti TaxID=509963 RepID=UPI002905D212|nr:dynactin subunit 6-like [Ylistrum balloti]
MSAKPKVLVSHGAVVCDECEIIGDVTIGARSVIHPKARIIADDGPIIIGENNIIEELVTIVNRNPAGTDANTQQVMIIGNNNVFEVGCYVEATKIGDHNVVEAKAKVGRQVGLTTGCIIGSMCSLTSNETLPDNTVIYGKECERRVQRERPPTQNLQIDFLTKILPNYHYIKKTKSGTPQRT